MDNSSKKTPTQYNPGELDKTRKNLGLVNQEESERMMKVLGGDIGLEKQAPESDALIKKVVAQRRYVPTESRNSSKGSKREVVSTKTNTSQRASVVVNPFAKKHTLPILDSRERHSFNRLMSSQEYHIKPVANFFAMLFSFARSDNERLSESFVQNELAIHIQHIDSFLTAIQHLILAAPGGYKESINNDDDPHFKALRLIYKWDTLAIKKQLGSLKEKKPFATVEDAIPFISELFIPLIQLYFLGESQMTVIIKKLYAKTSEVNGAGKMQNLGYAKQAASEWLYIFGQIIKGLYPLFMRMTLSQCEPFPDFYVKNISKILPFLGITKYDLVLPTKQKKGATKESASDSKQSSEGKATEAQQDQSNKESAIVSKDTLSQSLEILDRLFPQAGWKDLAQIPDMYSYFHPLYQFDDGFNLISPANPLQVTIVLLRIIEDFFKGCRNITLNIDKDPAYLIEQDSLQKIISDLSQYREVVFNKILNPDLRDYVNHVYAQKEYKKTKYAKKQLSSWLWQMKYYFHPHLAFEIIFIERPEQDNSYKSLPKRIHHLVQLFSLLISTSNVAEGAQKANFNAPYSFDVENNISYRLDILLGGKKSKARTNLNLMRYTLCVLRVLDWWINDPESIAYQEELKIPYRSDNNEGVPSFSVGLCSDQKNIFLRHAKKRIAEKAQTKAQADNAQPPDSSANTASTTESDKSVPPKAT